MFLPPCRQWVLCWILFGMANSARDIGLVFPRGPVQVTLPVNFPPHVPFYKVTAVPTEGSSGSLTYRIDRVVPSSSHRQGTRGRAIAFDINPSTGEVTLARNTSVGGQRSTGKSTIHVSVRDPSNSSVARKTTIEVRMTKTDSDSLCRPSLKLCYLNSRVNYTLAESVTPGVIIDRLRQPSTEVFCQNGSTEYRLLTGDVISVEPSTGNVILKNPLDYEESSVANFKIICSLNLLGDNTTEYIMQGTILVQDVDDNPPYLEKGKKTEYDFDSLTPLNQSLTDLTLGVLDKDSKDANHFDVRIEDPLNVFAILKVFEFENVIDGAMFMSATVMAKKPINFTEPLYNATVVFEDTTYRGDGQNKVAFTIRVHNRLARSTDLQSLPTYTHKNTVLSRNAAVYTRVFQPVAVDEKGFSFKLQSTVSPDERHVFGVTKNTGIVYVVDVDRLQTTNQSSFNLNITWSNNGSRGVIEVTVNLSDEEISFKNCDSLCSSFETKRACTFNCGVGVANGTCQWRENNNTQLSSKFTTCSSDLTTCPDGICDELEMLEKMLCPQDCASAIFGETTINKSGKGIHTAVGQCGCTSSTCTCFRDPPTLAIQEEEDEELRDQMTNSEKSGKFSSVSSTQKPNTPSTEEDDIMSTTVRDSVVNVRGLAHTTACGPGCVAFIFLAVSCSLVLCIIFMFYRRLKGRKKRHEKHKYVGSGMSLSAIPSDYVDERSSSVPNSQAFSDTSSSSKGVYDTKWEFPREHLILEQTLGEGEFGKVMKAQAWGINGTQMYSTVAVKMLKGNGTVLDQQDLLSEFQMLKEVNHPNVVRLLGACTQKGGPIYIIVDYAEQGSLRGFLRRSRHLEIGCDIPPVRSFDNPTYLSQSVSEALLPPEYHVSQRDLLSFAWQIAKGMAYLSDMKLVHRDLAARNVLVAAGKVLKISDFGLSRDVYEGDTYLKKSKGRVPVKWMAIESLEDHIYTTRSDVWSYGIVLWEIVTLGATPYPGITPERLFPLLKSGYRMVKPAHCLDELYQIMKSCWRENAHDRPAFKELVQRFDNLLQDTTDYMDLSVSSPDEVPVEPRSCLPYIPAQDKEDESPTVEYGSILHTQDEEYSETIPEDSVHCLDPVPLITITEPGLLHPTEEKGLIRDVQETTAGTVM